MRKIRRDGTSRRRAVVLLGAGWLACPVGARAGTFAWNGADASFGTFTQADNWIVGSAPPNDGTGDLIFGSLNPHGYSPTLNGNLDAHLLLFNTSALAYTIVTNGSGFSGVLTLEAPGLTDLSTNAETISGSTAVVLNANQGWNVAGGAFTDSTPLNLSTSVLTVNASVATGSATFSGTLSGAGAAGLTVTGPGTMTLSGSGSSIPALSLQGGLTQISSGSLALTINSGGGLVLNGGNLNISGGAVVSTTANLVGVAINNSLLTVTGNGSRLTTPLQIDVGNATAGNLSVLSNANVSSPQLLVFIGNLTIATGGVVNTSQSSIASSATGMINGSGSVLNATVGLYADGAITITNSGAANTALTVLDASTAVINVSGGSLNSGGLTSTAAGYGSIMLTDPGTGAALNINGTTGSNTYSGSISGAGTLNKSGGSTQTLSGPLSCGTVMVNGGTLNLALSNSSSNSISTLQMNGGLTQLSSGALTISSNLLYGTLILNGNTFNISGGAVCTLNEPIFEDTALEGTVNVTGMGSSLNSLSALFVGYNQPGKLVVTGGASVSVPNFSLLVGSSSGTVIINAGSSVTAAAGFDLAFGPGSSGIATVNGSGASLTAANLHMGGDFVDEAGGTGILTVSGGGSVTVSGPVIFDSATSSINVSNAVLNTGSLRSYNTGYGSIALADPSSGSALNINSSSGTNTYSGSISGTGGLSKSGGSTQTLSGNNSFTGPVLVSGGTLILNSTNQFTFANVSGGTLSLGTSSALAAATNVNVGPGGTLATGSSSFSVAIGTVNLSGGTLLNSTNGLVFELNQIVVSAAGGTVSDTSSFGEASFIFENPGAAITVTVNSTWTTTNGEGTIVNLAGSVPINISSGVTLTNGFLLAGEVFNITGGGTLYQNANPAQLSLAPITVTQGTFRVTDASTKDSQGFFVGDFGEGTFTLNGGTLSYGGATATTVKAINITTSGGTIQIESPTATLTDAGGISSSGQLLKTGPGTLIVPPFSATNLIINNGTLGLLPSSSVLSVSTLTVGALTTLDLGSDTLDISNGSLAAMNFLIQQGFAGGRWNGSGVTSSTAAADTKHLTALGVIQNNQGGTPLFTASHPFESTTPGISDILAKYTYYGDANLDGKVDGSDYTRIDSGYLTHATGWFNGDFNYDGVINGSDYTLIDNAFDTQGAQRSGEIATPTARLAAATGTSVPEPVNLALVTVGAVLLSRRVRRQHADRRFKTA